MGLKLTVGREDKIIVGNDIVIDVRTLSNNQVQLEFTAPKEVQINAIFKDSNKQFKKARKD